ncbi:MAG TPA: glycosyltransferase [Steroidobacteraceae bacterium]
MLKAMVWASGATILYTYVLYPIAVWMLAGLRAPRTAAAAAPASTPSFSVVLAVHNEAARITTRLDELVSLAEAAGRCAEVIVVTDGCRDGTAALARAHPSSLVRVVELPENEGKAQALSRGCAVANGEILVFADARQRWAGDSLRRLLANFDHADIGAVSGELLIEASPGVLDGVGFYWRYEKWLRRNEGRLNSTVGVSGSICAVRRALFGPIPRGVLLDDLYWPLQVVMQGHRVVHEERALAYDRLPPRPQDEFRRKVRTLSGNFQLATVLPQALLPWRNPIWIQFVSHKLLRLVVPWLLLVLLIASSLLDGPLYRTVFVSQLLFYGLAGVGLVSRSASKLRVAGVPGAFVVLNAAAWLAFWIWVSGRTASAWNKVAYDASLPRD